MRLSFYARYFQVEGGTSPSFGRPLCPTAIQPHNETGNGSGTANEDSTTEFGQPNAASSPNACRGTGPIWGICRRVRAWTCWTIVGAAKNFFGTLKKRLSRSKTRTLSADQPNSNHKSLSATNSNYANTTTTSTGLPRTATGTLNESSAISGFSSASNKTYVHEASTLVLETIENGVKRHFIVPLAIAQRPRWRRKGTKLHIYNDHTFIAKHLSGSGLQCSICMKSIPRRPGKQGYECRDCQLICHKQCHIRAPQACPNPTVLSMELTKLNSAAADRSIRKL
ncbi:uncharacterized protein LOC6604141 [Drosophila persimilis]|uniref:uncharacterized protein LOC6604141 n=1 Tax=Drosophila persimilis TaxID=7234 RepID=UPI000F086257|nr:uncharacterized protein LOC6604141 [Drosophila persimilis]